MIDIYAHVHALLRPNSPSKSSIRRSVATCALLVAVAYFAPSLSVLANTLTYTPPSGEQPGKLNGEIPIERVASLLLPDGVVQFADDEMKVGAVPDWLFDRELVLRGAILNAQVTPDKETSVVSGVVCFFDGSWLNHLSHGRSLDVIDTLAGYQIRGKIVARNADTFVVRQESGPSVKLKFSEIKSVTSPRCFTFRFSSPTTRLSPNDGGMSFETQRIAFIPTVLQGTALSKRATLPPSSLPGSEPGISNSAIGTFIALDVLNDIAPAISIPLVLNRSNQQAALNKIKQVVIQNTLNLPSTP